MTIDNDYIFTSDRLGFRKWRDEDFDDFAEMNADQQVMEHFPFSLSKKQSHELMNRLNAKYEQDAYTYFAVETLVSRELIGFIGISFQDYASSFNPSTDIGWRLKTSAWGKGYATEGAQRCLAFAFEEIGLDRIVSVCTVDNSKSENVMKKIGMVRKEAFIHTKLIDYPAYSKCLLYEITREEWNINNS